MRIGMKEEKIKNLAKISNQLQSGEVEYVDYIKKSTPEFKTPETVVINPRIDSEKVNIQFELRGNNEITAVGSLDEILKFFELEKKEEVKGGYKLQVKGGNPTKSNNKSYKYYVSECHYKKEVKYSLKKYFGLSQEEEIYFYRPDIFLLDEKETIDYLNKCKHFNKFTKFIKHGLKRQKLFHNIFNIPYELYYETLNPDTDEEVLIFTFSDNDGIKMFRSLDEISDFFNNGTRNELEPDLLDEFNKDVQLGSTNTIIIDSKIESDNHIEYNANHKQTKRAAQNLLNLLKVKNKFIQRNKIKVS